tara:strand:+ start:73 stop:438 length:366 start_codon:yes stop_codon:yes gene_type:complete
MDYLKHTYDTENDVYVVPRELMIETMEKLEASERGIMDYEHAGILGCDSYERFCQAMCELEHDEKWISELKRENKELKARVDELKVGIKYYMGCSSSDEEEEDKCADCISDDCADPQEEEE